MNHAQFHRRIQPFVPPPVMINSWSNRDQLLISVVDVLEAKSNMSELVKADKFSAVLRFGQQLQDFELSLGRLQPDGSTMTVEGTLKNAQQHGFNGDFTLTSINVVRCEGAVINIAIHNESNPIDGCTLPLTIKAGASVTVRTTVKPPQSRGQIRAWLLFEFETTKTGFPWQWQAEQFIIARQLTGYVVQEETALNPLTTSYVPQRWRAFERGGVEERASELFRVVSNRLGGRSFVFNPIENSGFAAAARLLIPRETSMWTQKSTKEQLFARLRSEMSLHVKKMASVIAPPAAQVDTPTMMQTRTEFCDMYKRRLHSLLLLEEGQHMQDIKQFDLYNIRLKRQKYAAGQMFYRFEIPGLVGKRVAVNINDTVMLRRPYRWQYANIKSIPGQIPKCPPPQEFAHYDAKVVNVDGNQVYIQFIQPTTDNEPQKNEMWFVRMFHNSQVFDFMHQAVNELNFDENVERLIWPIGSSLPPTTYSIESLSELSIDDTIENMPWTGNGEKLNYLQQSVVAKLVSGKVGISEPHLIFGPPGTGKTMTVVEATWQLIQSSPTNFILLTAPSNAAADVLCDRLQELGLGPSDLHRFVWSNRKIEFLLPSILPFVNQDSRTGKIRYLDADSLKQKRVIVSTCLAAAKLRDLVSRDTFTHVFVDEAAQALEAETLVPLSLANARCCIVLSGDPHQLGAVIRCPAASQAGLAVSLMERLMKLPLYTSNHRELYVTALKNNYRSHVRILQLSSDLFYDGTLVSCANPQVVDRLCNWSELQHADFPLKVYDVQGVCTCQQNSISPANRQEAVAIADIVTSLIETTSVSLSDFGVMTPFRNQVTLIRKILRAEGYGAVRVGTIDDYQGQEALIAIISTVVSEGYRPDSVVTSFFMDPKRFNVAISRGKGLCVIVGNTNYLHESKFWSFAIDFCNNGGHKGEIEDAQRYTKPERDKRLLGSALDGWYSMADPEELHSHFRSMELEWAQNL